MDHRTNGSTLWVAIYILDNEYGHVSLGRLALLLAIWLAAVCYSLEKARKQSKTNGNRVDGRIFSSES
jgi:hypothetical protein